ncbi:hypothetical protein [Staphylococcus saprophyticus]|uniref:hypothetical protein n=1 Tax=Staphylococcus saprophyticus TaxID=29385 RepID=UPI0008531AC9|nr:hypothetical protein [Staphylococcus saprophyticus]OEK41289.1 hypothetical protein ASS88_01380 [Staphylococcus saprophyticus]
MTLLPLEKLNTEVRNLFNEYYREEFHPNLRMVCEKIGSNGIGYATLKNFKTGTDTTYSNLTKILTFLESKGYKLKEHA